MNKVDLYVNCDNKVNAIREKNKQIVLNIRNEINNIVKNP